MEYEELRDRFETLTNQLEVTENSLSQSESRVHDSIKRTETVQRKASSLAQKFGEIARDLDEIEKGIKNSGKQSVTENETEEQELFEKEQNWALKSDKRQRFEESVKDLRRRRSWKGKPKNNFITEEDIFYETFCATIAYIYLLARVICRPFSVKNPWRTQLNSI